MTRRRRKARERKEELAIMRLKLQLLLQLLQHLRLDLAWDLVWDQAWDQAWELVWDLAWEWVEAHRNQYLRRERKPSPEHSRRRWRQPRRRPPGPET